MSSSSQTKRIAWFSSADKPETAGSVSVYTERVLRPLLEKDYEIERFTDSFEDVNGSDVFHFLSAYCRHRENPFDLFFYQFEDLPQAEFIRIHLALIPGIVWYHNVNMKTHGPEPILNSPWYETVEMFNGERVDFPGRLIKRKIEDAFAVRELGMGTTAVFSNPEYHLQYRNRISQILELRAEAGSLRSSYHLPYPAEATLQKRNSYSRIGLIGTSLECKAHKVLEAASSAESEYSVYWLVNESDKCRAEGMLKEFELEAEVVTGASPENWKELLKRIDIAVHLNYSTYSHNSPYTEVSMASGLPVIVSDFGSGTWLPDDIVCKIQPGRDEVYQMKSVFEAFARGEVSFEAEKVADYASEYHSIPGVYQELKTIIEHESERCRIMSRQWIELENKAGSSLLAEAAEILKSEDSTSTEKALSESFVDGVLSSVKNEIGWSVTDVC